LEVLNKELEAFSYSVSHDLRAPLRAIDGFSQAILEDYHDQVDEEGQDFLRRIQAASRHMARLIDDILLLSRISRAELRHGAVKLSALASAVAAELQKASGKQQVDFIAAPGIEVKGDPNLLRIVMENLLNNAYKFMGNKSGTIEFGMIVQDEKPVYFVRDTGVGFDMAYANKLFAPFQRLHREDEFEGIGIGLATVQRVIHRHGGHIWAEGEVGKGATFYFTLRMEME
jgi:light-regulated signal transduction histidine kinase (bacteriophytochrome)